MHVVPEHFMEAFEEGKKNVLDKLTYTDYHTGFMAALEAVKGDIRAMVDKLDRRMAMGPPGVVSGFPGMFKDALFMDPDLADRIPDSEWP